jgi:hypothetical protein
MATLIKLPEVSATQLEAEKRRVSTEYIVGSRELPGGKTGTVTLELYSGVTSSFGRGSGKVFYARIANKTHEPRQPGDTFQVSTWSPLSDKTILTGEAPARFNKKALVEFHSKALDKLAETAETEMVQGFLAGQHAV